MYLENIIKTLQSLSPPWLTLQGDDGPGLVFGRKTSISSIIIRKAVVSVDPTIECIDEAIASKANLIISHHPLFHDAFLEIRELSFEKTRLLTTHNVWVYNTGDSWNHASQGITESICQALRLEFKEAFVLQGRGSRGDEIPVGRVVDLHGSKTFGAITDQAKAILGRAVITCKGDPGRLHERALVIGGMVDYIQPVTRMLEDGIDLFIAGELSGQLMTTLIDLGIDFMSLSHHETDLLGMSKLKGLLSLKHPNVTFMLHAGNPLRHV